MLPMRPQQKRTMYPEKHRGKTDKNQLRRLLEMVNTMTTYEIPTLTDKIKELYAKHPMAIYITLLIIASLTITIITKSLNGGKP